MKIWIVSSDPFYREFEKISKIWAKEGNIIKICLVSKFGYNVSSLVKFSSIYLKFKPAVILTDHGYFGFWFIWLLGRLLRIKTKYNFYLRGNYWLEEDLRNEKTS